jgi:hypothetical protein
MRVHCGSTTTSRVLLVLCCLLLPGEATGGKLVPRRDFRDGILDAELVVIALQQSPGRFQVEEVFLGNASNGDPLELPGFQLATAQEYGPDILDPISSETRILLFLHHKKDSQAWEPTEYANCYFWVQDPQLVGSLRNTAEQAVALHRQWEEAAKVSDPRRRAEALWPFLSFQKYGSSFFEHTKSQLHDIGPVAADYFAEQFDTMPLYERGQLYKDIGPYGSDKLHDTLAHHIQTQQSLYETYVRTSGLDPAHVLGNWNALPEHVKDTYGEIYYGLAGLASFARRGDLPKIREIALWAVTYRQQQTCEVAVDAFRNMPDEANLPIISLIYETFFSVQQVNDEVFHADLIQSLCAHKFPQTVPLLAPFVTDVFAGAEVQAALSAIVGEDLGEEPQPWLDWYAAKTTPHAKTGPRIDSALTRDRLGTRSPSQLFPAHNITLEVG